MERIKVKETSKKRLALAFLVLLTLFCAAFALAQTSVVFPGSTKKALGALSSMLASAPGTSPPPATGLSDMWIYPLKAAGEDFECNMFNPTTGAAFGVCFPPDFTSGTTIKFPVSETSIEAKASRTYVGIYKGTGKQLSRSISSHSGLTKKNDGTIIKWSDISSTGVEFYFEKGKKDYSFSVEGWTGEKFQVYVCQDKTGNGNCGASYIEPNPETASLTITQSRVDAALLGAEENHGPILDVSWPEKVKVGEQITIDASDSYDVDAGNILEFYWKIIDSPDASKILHEIDYSAPKNTGKLVYPVTGLFTENDMGVWKMRVTVDDQQGTGVSKATKIIQFEVYGEPGVEPSTECGKCNTILTCLACIDSSFVKGIFKKKLERTSGYIITTEEGGEASTEKVEVKETVSAETELDPPTSVSANPIEGGGVIVEWDTLEGDSFEVLAHSAYSASLPNPNEFNLAKLPSTVRLYPAPIGKKQFIHAAGNENFGYSVRALKEGFSPSDFFPVWIPVGSEVKKFSDVSSTAVTGDTAPGADTTLGTVPGGTPGTGTPPTTGVAGALDERSYVVVNFANFQDKSTQPVPGTDYLVKVDIKVRFLAADMTAVKVLDAGGSEICEMPKLHARLVGFGRLDLYSYGCGNLGLLVFEFVSFGKDSAGNKTLNFNLIFNESKATKPGQLANYSRLKGYEFAASPTGSKGDLPGTAYSVEVTDIGKDKLTVDLRLLDGSVPFCEVEKVNEGVRIDSWDTWWKTKAFLAVKKVEPCKDLKKVYYIYTGFKNSALGYETVWVFYEK